MASFTERMIGAAKLDVHTYEEVEADPNAIGQAMIVVVISSVAAGIGSLAQAGVAGLVVGSVVALIGWFIWAFLTFIIGTKVFPEPETKSNMGELLRTIGFAATPGVLKVFGVVPMLGTLISFAASIWMLVAMVIAVRQALDYKSTGRAIGVCLIGWVIYIIAVVFLLGMLLVMFGLGAAAMR
ncbi:MAG TPA: YIP1 family protein [Candidatus Acidoferrales bacterium]|nr:YIP1 family protein [Candidatus Acidoferrales bacterium]